MGQRAGKRNSHQGGVYFDYSLLFIVIFMLCFGLVMLYSASYYESAMEYGDSGYYLKKQLLSTVLGFGVMVVVIRLNYEWFNKPAMALLAFAGSVLLILMVLSPLGIERNGARRWINLGMSVQPSEVAKLGLIIFMAFFINRNSKRLKNARVFFTGLVYTIIIAGMVAVVTSNLSSAIVIAGIGAIMLFVSCPRIIYFVEIAGMGVAAVIVAIIAEPYRLERFNVWLNPEAYPNDGGYQTMQSLYALGSGGLFGKGLGKGIQKLGYIPEAQNDMIFTVICEELGLIGGIAVILLFIFLIWRFMIIANNAGNLFGSMLVVGVMAHIALQVVMNIAVVTNAMPNTGVTLPFVSYGGSSTLCLLAEIGLVLSVSKRIRFE